MQIQVKRKLPERPKYTAWTTLHFNIDLKGPGQNGRSTLGTVEELTGLDQRALSLMTEDDIECRISDAFNEWVNSLIRLSWEAK